MKILGPGLLSRSGFLHVTLICTNTRRRTHCYFHLIFEDQFNKEQLEEYINQLNVEDYYAKLRRV